jgi:hypothetical protein
MAALLAADGLAAGLGADLTGIAHASDPTRPGKAWNEITLPFDNGTGIAMCRSWPCPATGSRTPHRPWSSARPQRLAPGQRAARPLPRRC